MGRHVSPAGPTDEHRDEGHGIAGDKTIISSFKRTFNAWALLLAIRPRATGFLLGLLTGLLAADPEALGLLLDHLRS